MSSRSASIALFFLLYAARPAFADVLDGPVIDMPDETTDPGKTAQPMANNNAGSLYSDTEVGTGRRTAIGGYGEADLLASDRATETQFRRMVLFLGHDFGDTFSFYSEIEFENGGATTDVEQAYLEGRLHPKIGIRAGVLLVPLGIVNVLHEPPTYLTVLRPLTDQIIIPSTWREMGAGIFGEPVPGFHYQLYLTSGLNAANFSAEKGIRAGRGGARTTETSEPAVTGRLHYNGLLGLDAGIGAYFGGAGQRNSSLENVRVTMVEADARYFKNGFELRAQFARFDIVNSWRVNQLLASLPTPAAPIGSQGRGFYGQAGYDVLRLIAKGSSHQLWTFLNYENVNASSEVSSLTLGATPTRARQYGRIGLSYKPHWQIAFKMDYQLALADTAGGNQLGFGASFMF